MAISVGDALLKVGVDTNEAMSKLEDFGSKIKATGQSISKASTPFLIAGTVITGALTGLIMKATSTGDAFDKMSLRTGVSVEDLSRLKYAAETSGTSIEGVETSLKFLTKAMDSATEGSGKAYDAFTGLGISVTNADGSLRPMIDVMEDAATKIAAIDNPAKQSAIAMELFGARAGTDLLPLLKMGGDGIDELMKKADDLGITMSTKAATAAAEFEDKLTDLKGSLNGVGITIGTSLMPVIMDFINTYIMPLIKKIQEIPIETLTRDIKILAGAGGILLLIGAVGKLIGIFSSLGSLFTPTGLILAGIGLFIGLIIQIVKHWDGIKTAMTGFYGKYIKPWLDPLIDGLEWVVHLFEKVGGFFHSVGSKITSVFTGGEAVTGTPGGHFASGGIVTKPTMAMIGEGGPEAVIPLPLNGMSNDELLRIQKDMLKELRKFNDFTSKQIARDISLGISGLGQKA